MWNIKLIFIIPVCLIGGGLYSLINTGLFLSKAIATTGYVTELKQSTKNTYSTDKQGYRHKTGSVIEYQPVIRFTAENGRQVSFNSKIIITGKSKRYKKYRTGRKIALLYDPQYPAQSARINSFSGKWGVTLFLFAFGIASIILCRWLLNSHSNRHKLKKEQENNKKSALLNQKNTIPSQEYKKPEQIKVNVFIFTFIMLCLIYAALTDSYTSDQAGIFMITFFLIPFIISWYVLIQKNRIFKCFGESLCVLESYPVSLNGQLKGHIELTSAYPEDLEYSINLMFSRHKQVDYSKSLLTKIQSDINGKKLFFQFDIPDKEITIIKDNKEIKTKMTSDVGYWWLNFSANINGEDISNSYIISVNQ